MLVVKEAIRTVEKKPPFLVRTYIVSKSLRSSINLNKSLKTYFFCKLQIVFENKTKLGNNFLFIDGIPFSNLTFGIFYKFQSGLCSEAYYGECGRHFNVRISEHIGI